MESSYSRIVGLAGALFLFCFSTVLGVQPCLLAANTASPSGGNMPPPPEPRIIPYSSLTICMGEYVELDCDKEFAAYRWSTGDTTRSILADAMGPYFLDAMNSEGEWGRSDTVYVTVVVAEEMPIYGPEYACVAGQKYTYRSRPDSSHSILWAVIGGTIQEPYCRDSIVVVWKNALYGTILLDALDLETGCESQARKVVTLGNIKATLNYDADDYILLCEGDSVLLKVEGEYDSYYWDFNHREAEYWVTKAGRYACEVTKSGCSGRTNWVTVNALTKNELQLNGPDTVCAGSVEWYSIVPGTNLSFQWQITGGQSLSPKNSSTQKIQWDTIGQGHVSVMVHRGDCSLAFERPVRIIENAPPARVIWPGEPYICYSNPVTLEVSPGYTRYLWSTGDTTRTISVKRYGKYYFTGYIGNGCSARSDTVGLSTWPNPPNPDVLQQGPMLITSHDTVDIQWYMSGVAIPGATSRTVKIEQFGDYTVRYTNAWGCFIESEPYTVSDLRNDPAMVIRDFRLSPNPGNGAFDLWIDFLHAAPYSYTVYNALGQKVLTHSEPIPAYSVRERIALDGLPTGVYYFQLLADGDSRETKLIIVR